MLLCTPFPAPTLFKEEKSRLFNLGMLLQTRNRKLMTSFTDGLFDFSLSFHIYSAF